jgi:type I restriction enzyme, S subunit
MSEWSEAPEWSEATLRDVTTVLRRGTTPVYVDSSPVIAIGQRCVRSTGLVPSAGRPHDERVPVQLRPEPDDVLLNSLGAGTIGRSCVFNGTPGTYMVDGNITLLRANCELAVGPILNEILRSAEGQTYLESRCYKGSTNQVGLSLGQLAAMPVRLPPLAEQRRIAEILDTIDDTIRATERIIHKQRRLAEAVLEGELQRWADSAVPLKSVCDKITVGVVSSATQAYDSEGVPFVRSQNVRPGIVEMTGMLRVSTRFVEQHRNTRLELDDVLIVRTGYPGTAAVVTEELVGGSCFSLLVVRPRRSDFDSHFLATFMNSAVAKRQVTAMQFGSAQHNLNVGQIRDLRVPYPSMEEQLRTVRISSAAREIHDREVQILGELQQVRAGLAADLLSGRVRTVEP